MVLLPGYVQYLNLELDILADLSSTSPFLPTPTWDKNSARTFAQSLKSFCLAKDPGDSFKLIKELSTLSTMSSILARSKIGAAMKLGAHLQRTASVANSSLGIARIQARSFHFSLHHGGQAGLARAPVYHDPYEESYHIAKNHPEVPNRAQPTSNNTTRIVDTGLATLGVAKVQTPPTMFGFRASLHTTAVLSSTVFLTGRRLAVGRTSPRSNSCTTDGEYVDLHTKQIRNNKLKTQTDCK